MYAATVKFQRPRNVWTGSKRRRAHSCGPVLKPLQDRRALSPTLVALIEAPEAKGRCYTAMARLLLNLGDLYGRRAGGACVVERRITHDALAALIGSTRPWVTMMLKRFQADGIVAVDMACIRILRPERLTAIVQAAT